MNFGRINRKHWQQPNELYINAHHMHCMCVRSECVMCVLCVMHILLSLQLRYHCELHEMSSYRWIISPYFSCDTVCEHVCVVMHEIDNILRKNNIHSLMRAIIVSYIERVRWQMRMRESVKKEHSDTIKPESSGMSANVNVTPRKVFI